MKPMWVGDELLSGYRIRKLLTMVRRDAEELAGQFYDACRSEKFRTAWREVGLREGRDPQLVFVEREWTHFVEHVRMKYCEMLSMPEVSEDDKDDIHKALIIQASIGRHSQRVPIQIAPGTQQFEGDKFENREIAKTYGTHAEPSLLRKLMSSTAH